VSSSKRKSARVVARGVLPVFLRTMRKGRTESGRLRGCPLQAPASTETWRDGISCTMAPVPLGVCGRSVGPAQAAMRTSIESAGNRRPRAAFSLTGRNHPSTVVAAADVSGPIAVRREAPEIA
jgi:hypothetical protein